MRHRVRMSAPLGRQTGWLLLTLLLVTSGVTVRAQTEADVSCPEGEMCIWFEPADAASPSGEFSLDDGPITLAPPGGSVRIVFDGTTIRCERFTLNPQTRTGTAEGGVTVNRGGLHVISASMRFDFEAERFELEGDVVAEQTGETVRTLTAERLVLTGDGGSFEAEGGVRVEEETMTAWAASVRYDEAAETMELHGEPARVEQTDGSGVSASRLMVYLAEGARTVETYGAGRIILQRDDSASDAGGSD